MITSKTAYHFSIICDRLTYIFNVEMNEHICFVLTITQGEIVNMSFLLVKQKTSLDFSINKKKTLS
jgi:hypothetical protein